MLQIKGLLAVYVYDVMRKIPLVFVSPLVLYPECSCTCSYILIPGFAKPTKQNGSCSFYLPCLFLNPFAPGNFAEKCVLKLVEQVFWTLSHYKELKITMKQFTGHTLGNLLIQKQNISFWISGMCRKQNHESDKAVLSFTFYFSCFICFLLLGIW